MATAKKRSIKKAARGMSPRHASPKKRSAKKYAPKKMAVSGTDTLAKKFLRMSQAASFGPPRSASSTSTVTMRDGRTVKLRETAVHEIKSGKIQSERWYYDPSALAPPQQRLL